MSFAIITPALITAGVAGLVAAIMTIILLKLVDKLIGLRVDPRVEEIGLDLSQHGSYLSSEE